jgi:RNA polymerase sigma-70 factor (ECF subfamily)
VGNKESQELANPGQDEIYRLAADEFGSALDRLAYAYENDPDRRRDLIQEIHLSLWRSLEGFDGRCSLRTWTYRVAHNVAASYVVRQNRKKWSTNSFLTLDEAESQTVYDNVEASTDRRRSLERLLVLIHQLDLIDRQLMLAYLEGLDAESIGEITGLSVANVWTRIHRIKNLLTRQFYKGDRDG